MHGGAEKDNLKTENMEALKKGIPNLLRHVENITGVYGLPCVVAINRFRKDSDEEIAFIENECRKLGVNVCASTVWEFGGEGGKDLAREVVRLCDEKSTFRYCYDIHESIAQKINAIATKVYGGEGVDFTDEAKEQLAKIESLGFGNLPVCMAKTQYSFSDDAKKLGAPAGFRITVRQLKVCAGAGFVVALTGNILTMPGLPKHPAAENIDVDSNGVITGLF